MRRCLLAAAARKAARVGLTQTLRSTATVTGARTAPWTAVAPGRWEEQSCGFASRGVSSQAPPEDGPDSHPDFKPVSHVEATPGVEAYIEKCLTDHKVFLFMKGSPAAPQCGFSNTTVRILQHYNVSFGAADVLSDPDLREGIKQFSKWPTIPQVYVDKEFLGGSDILMAMHQSGELAEVFGVPQPKAE